MPAFDPVDIAVKEYHWLPVAFATPFSAWHLRADGRVRVWVLETNRWLYTPDVDTSRNPQASISGKEWNYH